MLAKYGAPPSQFAILRPGLTVHFRDEGPRDAPVVMLLHGSNADLHTWDAWTAALTDRYRVVRFDQIGHGLTGADPAGDYAEGNFADDVGRMADKLRLKRFVLAGNSMGGGIALAYALRHPERLDGLVLLDSVGSPPVGKAEGNLAFTLARNPVGGWLMTRITPRSLIDKSLHQSVRNQAIVTPAMVDRYWELLRFPGNRAATVARFSRPMTSFPASDLARLKVPVLIQWGEGDPLIPLAAGQWLHRAIPGSRMIVYPGIGHIPMEEAPDKSAADLRGWLAMLPSTGGGAGAAAGAPPRVDAHR
ncbi:alpha/beta fold hydrolase [Novosphingobium sp. Gsoil 351]|nr:alpha/beta fold hydrolase [Novosphingobium sp. Gsoil 351]